MPNTTEADDILQHARPVVNQRGHETSRSATWQELQAWFVAEHVVDTPAVRVDAEP